MKKILALLLTGALLFSLAACKKQEEIPSDETVVASMKDPIDSLARCMVENQTEYAPDDPEFFWTALYYFAGAYSSGHEGVELLADTYQLKVPTSVMEEYAIALFSDYKGLPDLPDALQGNVSYDAESDAYLLYEGDIGLSETRLSNIEPTEDGYTLTAELWGTDGEEALIAAFDVTLVRNTFSDEIETPAYLCSVSAMTMTERNTSDSSLTPEQTITAVFNGLSDSHTVEVTMEDGSVRAFQFDEASDAGQVIGALAEGDTFTLGFVTDGNNGSLVIVTATAE